MTTTMTGCCAVNVTDDLLINPSAQEKRESCNSNNLIIKNNIAKHNWWHSSAKPLELSPTILQSDEIMKNSQQSTELRSYTKIPTNHKCETPQLASTATQSPSIRTGRSTPKPAHLVLPPLTASSLSMSARKQICNYEIKESPSYRKFNENDNISQDSSRLITAEDEPCCGVLNANEEDEMKITGYRRCLIRTIICWICICLTGGLLRLILHWWRHWYLIATHTKCPLSGAMRVLVEEDYQGKHKLYYVKSVINLNATVMKEYAPKLMEGAGTDTHAAMADTLLDDKDLYLSMHFTSAQMKRSKSVRIFTCKQLRYAWDPQRRAFMKLKGLDVNIPCAYYHQQKAFGVKEQLSRYTVYGQNEITVPYKDVKTLLFLEALNPFYVFQIFSVILWFTYDYYYYACVILLMSIFGIGMSIIQTKKNQDALCETVKNTGTAFIITDNGKTAEVPTQHLVPGHIIEIPSDGCIMQCDAVLISGNCILDESMLTGESVPVTKTPLPTKRDVMFDKKEHARHTLFCGTKVIQTRYIGSEKVLAFVINTGNITTKGGLIRSILYPPPVDYKFEKDSYKFIECLGLIALIGFIYTLTTKIMRGIDPVKIAVESLDLITIVVPPALPAAMTVGRLYAQKRLEKSNIFCISPRSINVAGSIDCCCFDKTGTLTEDGLDMWGVVPKSVTNQFQMPLREIERLPFDNLLFSMVTCHSITILNGKMMGDPLDLKMFESTKWILEDPKYVPDTQKYGLMHPTIMRPPPRKQNGVSLAEQQVGVGGDAPERQSSVDNLLADVELLTGEYSNDHGIVREFPFTSSLQRMSVITRRLCEKHFNVYCKGSPEMLQQLCKTSSLPENYSQQLAVFAKQGYRVIAMAFKPLSRKINYTKVQRLTREAVESDLEFLGFVVLENRLKTDSTKVIQALTKANIRTIMVTGDNILTAVSVARDCGIINGSQAVVTVNVKESASKDEEVNMSNGRHNYELYYTLELASKDYIPTSTDQCSSTKGDLIGSLNYDGQDNCPKLNGDVGSLNSLPNSDSMTSVKTCETFTHNEIELGLALNSSATSSPHNNTEQISDWRQDYRFAMVGRTWQILKDYFPQELRLFLTRGAIYARMAPEQKQALIMELQNIDYCVAMCGDGANDCGALKVAHTGISLSETESSIASPFTSRNPTIAAVPNVIKEGRAALVTSFGIFKYMAAYSMVQFISVMILYSIDSNLTDKQYLYIDLGLISVFAFFFGKTEAYTGPLAKQVPLNSLISLAPLGSILLHLVIVVVFQVTGWFHLHHQSWFKPFHHEDEEHLGCYENYAMFAISSFQYIILAFVFSKGAPYRRPIWTNWIFCLTLMLNLCIVVYLVVYPTDWLADFFQLIMPPTMAFRYWMLIYGFCNFVGHLIIEEFIVEYIFFKKLEARREKNLQTTHKKYLQTEYDLQYFHNWPNVMEACDVFDKAIAMEEQRPTYVEISAEQSLETPISNNNALNSFFEFDSGVATPIQTQINNNNA